MQALANSPVFWILLFLVLIVVFFLPTLIGLIRGVDRLALVFLVNLIGAPSFIGWPAALILAFGPRPNRHCPDNQTRCTGHRDRGRRVPGMGGKA